MEEKLVGTHPRDALLVLREKNLVVKEAKKREIALVKARRTYETRLKEFAEKFLADENAFLPPAQKEELAKICALQCKKEMGLISGSLTAGLCGLWWAVNYSPYFFAALPLVLFFAIWGIVSIVEIFDFLRARRILKTASAEELKNLHSAKKIPARDSHYYNTPTEKTI